MPRPSVGDNVTWISRGELFRGVIVLIADGYKIRADGLWVKLRLASVEVGDSSVYRCLDLATMIDPGSWTTRMNQGSQQDVQLNDDQLETLLESLSDEELSQMISELKSDKIKGPGAVRLRLFRLLSTTL